MPCRERSALLIAKKRSIQGEIRPPGALSAHIEHGEGISWRKLPLSSAQRSRDLHPAGLTAKQRGDEYPTWLWCAPSANISQEEARLGSYVARFERYLAVTPAGRKRSGEAVR